MPNDKKRLCLTLPDDIATDIAAMKQQLFGQQSNTAMYRHLIRLGLDALKASESPKSPREDT